MPNANYSELINGSTWYKYIWPRNEQYEICPIKGTYLGNLKYVKNEFPKYITVKANYLEIDLIETFKYIFLYANTQNLQTLQTWRDNALEYLEKDSEPYLAYTPSKEDIINNYLRGVENLEKEATKQNIKWCLEVIEIDKKNKEKLVEQVDTVKELFINQLKEVIRNRTKGKENNSVLGIAYLDYRTGDILIPLVDYSQLVKSQADLDNIVSVICNNENKWCEYKLYHNGHYGHNAVVVNIDLLLEALKKQ